MLSCPSAFILWCCLGSSLNVYTLGNSHPVLQSGLLLQTSEAAQSQIPTGPIPGGINVEKQQKAVSVSISLFLLLAFLIVFLLGAVLILGSRAKRTFRSGSTGKTELDLNWYLKRASELRNQAQVLNKSDTRSEDDSSKS